MKTNVLKLVVFFSALTAVGAHAFEVAAANAAEPAKSIQCTRIDSPDSTFLKNVVKAEIFKRRHDFDTRIRFFDKNGKQIDTCSTDLGTDNLFKCWNAGGVQGEIDEISMELQVTSEEVRSSLAEFNKLFELLVSDLARGIAKFNCNK